MSNREEKYINCPICSERKVCRPNATYFWQNCNKKFYVKEDNKKTYIVDKPKNKYSKSDLLIASILIVIIAIFIFSIFLFKGWIFYEILKN